MNALSKISPWLAKPLAEAAKQPHFRAVMDLRAHSVLLSHSWLIAGWVVGGVGVACLGASIFGWITVLPLAHTEYVFEDVDRSTGIITKAVGLEDAPTLFHAASERHYLRLYIAGRESWVPEDDISNDHLVKIMSRPDEQARYAAWRTSPNSPMTMFVKDRDAHVSIENFRYNSMPSGSKETRRYLVQFDRIVWKGSARDSSQVWTATVDFQWHPELPMKPADRDLNTGGFQAIAYSANSDTPDQRRQ